MDNPDQHPPLSPALRAAQAYVDHLGRLPAPPLPRDIYALADYMIRARNIRRDLEALAAGTGIGPWIPCGALMMALLATRPWGDVDPSVLGLDEEDREHWLIPLAIAVAEGWRLHNPVDRQQLKALASQRKCSRGEVKVELVARAVLLIQDRREGEYSVRLGKKWVKDTKGKKRHDVQPMNDLDWVQYLRWWKTQVYAAAEDMLHDEMSSADTSMPMETMADREDEAAGILVALETEPMRDAVAELAELSDDLTPRQRQVLEALLQPLLQDPDLPIDDAKAEAAEVLKVDPKAINMTFSRIRKRMGS